MPESPRRFVISCGVMAVAAAVILPARAAGAAPPAVFWVSASGSAAQPNPPAPAFVRPVDIVTGPAIDPLTFGNTFDGRPYHPA